MPAPSGEDPRSAARETTVWERVARMDDFKKLLAARKAFAIPATIFFVVYYFALPVSVGYFPEFMERKVWGPVNLAYLFALSQFVVAWLIAYLYVRAARKFDAYSETVSKDLEHIVAEGN